MYLFIRAWKGLVFNTYFELSVADCSLACDSVSQNKIRLFVYLVPKKKTVVIRTPQVKYTPYDNNPDG